MQTEFRKSELSFGPACFVFSFWPHVAIRIVPVDLCGCETWSVTFREEHRLRLFENGVLRRTFGPKRDATTAELRRLHAEELRVLCC